MRILLLENDPAMAHVLQQSFLREQYEIKLCSTAPDGVGPALGSNYDGILLGLDNSDLGGLLLLKRIRTSKPAAAILVISGSADIEYRVQLLDASADDVLSKPFSLAELCARMRRLLRRARVPSESTLHFADIELDRVERTVRQSGSPIELTTREFVLLEYLMRNAGREVSRDMIMHHVWGVALNSRTNVIDVYVNYLRKKLDRPGSPSLIETIRGLGYSIRAAGLGDEPPRRAGTMAASQAAQASD